jgi:hypothetical protein
MVKDDKDWTWVLERPCPECGFDASSVEPGVVAGMLLENAAAWAPVLADPRATTRPSDEVWSALEYGCHVRDVFRIYDERLRRMLTEDDPLYPNWDQDATAVEDRYSEQTPDQVASEILVAGIQLADRFDQVSGDAWRRGGRRSDGATFTVDTFSRYLVHDPIHHLHDVHRGYDALRTSGAAGEVAVVDEGGEDVADDAGAEQ